MRPTPNERAEAFRVAGPRNSNYGMFIAKCEHVNLTIMVSDGAGWDHVSVSLLKRCPTWDEMCWVKRLFFTDDEAVMQIHPRQDDYVNFHESCLHLWRPQTEAEIQAVHDEWDKSGDEWPYGDLKPQGVIPLPPTWMIGPKQHEQRYS